VLNCLRKMGMEMVILMKKVNIFKDFTNILINNLFSGSSLNTSNNSCIPRQVYRDLVPACGHHGECGGA
jgi:hypothetical protein